jgi:single-stranded-DNA-specific exonuclease
VINHPDYKSKRWEIAPRIDSRVAEEFKEYPVLAGQLLYNRGITSRENANSYLEAPVPQDSDPFCLKGMALSVDRISRALAQNQKIIIYGDYDVDGVTATALLYETLRGLGADVDAYIPDRFDEGYGLNKTALKNLFDQGASLVISVDCGARSVEEAEYSREIGLDLIITDHHQPLKVIPDAFAVINPKLPDQDYPYIDLAGVGVAYKLAQALLDKLGGGSSLADRWLDLVALGTVADLAPLTGENRFLVKRGLDTIHSGRRLGLSALCRAAGVNQAMVTASDIGFMLGPRLNAAGRLETAMNAYHLLIASDLDEAQSLASLLNKQNTDRQELTRQTQQIAMDRIGEIGPDDFILFVVDAAFNEGIVGLAASRLAEAYHRPAIVGVIAEKTTRCSCRSIPGFHITQALDECSDLFVRHGGHAAAAGFTVLNENLETLQIRLREIARRELNSKDLTPVLSADAEAGFSDLNPKLLGFLDLLQPTGYGNPEPYFVARNLIVKNKRAIGSEGKHLKMTLSDGWLTLDAICFRYGFLLNALPDRVDVLFSFERNIYNGQVYLQMNVKDIKSSE